MAGRRPRSEPTAAPLLHVVDAARLAAAPLLAELGDGPEARPTAWRCAVRRLLQLAVARSGAASQVLQPTHPAPGWGALESALDARFGPVLESGWPSWSGRTMDEAVPAWWPRVPALDAVDAGALLAPLSGLAFNWDTADPGKYGALRKGRGAYFTAELLVNALLDDLEAHGGPVVGPVCDPACGSGAMLRAALCRIAPEPVPASVEALYGVDIDALAVEMTRLSLWAAAGWRPEAASGLRARIRRGDALIGGSPPGAPAALVPPPGGVAAFDWADAFPEVWGRGGFEVVLVNPPWERIKFQARDYLRGVLPDAAQAAHRAEREEALAARPELAASMTEQRDRAAELAGYLRSCGAFPWSAHGDLNTFPLFVERTWQLLAPRGRAGVIVPTGLVADYGHRHLLEALLAHDGLVAIYDFENRRRVFPDVDSRFRFALVVLARGAEPRHAVEVATLLQHPDERHARTWQLQRADLARLNPLSQTLPLFRSAASAEAGLRMHRLAPPFDGALDPGDDRWEVRFQRMFDMTLDAQHFVVREDRPRERRADPARRTLFETVRRVDDVPLLEGKLFWQHDGAFATFEGCSRDARRRGVARPMASDAAHREAVARFWVPRDVFEGRRSMDAPFWLVVRALTNPTNARTLVAALVPAVAVGNSALIVHVAPAGASAAEPVRWLPLLAANLNCLVLDDLARQKMGNTNVNMFMLRQLPLLRPSAYDTAPFPGAPSLGELVARRALGLAMACSPIAAQATTGPWGVVRPILDEEARRQALAELDALYAHVYGFDEDGLRHVLTPPSPEASFAVLQRNEEERFGCFDTAERTLAAFRSAGRWTTQRTRGLFGG